MPELWPIYQRLVELFDGDRLGARLLTMYGLPPVITGCSQAVFIRTDNTPILVRNYEFWPHLTDAFVYQSHFVQRVIGMVEGGWGLLDGVNHAGLALSITFGGAPTTGEGFSIPIICRYLLEVCETVDEALVHLQRLPINAAQNMTLVDRSGKALSVFLEPGTAPRLAPEVAVTNHQETVAMPEHAAFTCTVERQQRLRDLAREREPITELSTILQAYREPPLFRTDYTAGFGTVYTAAYEPVTGQATYQWSDSEMWEQSFTRFVPRTTTITYRDSH